VVLALTDATGAPLSNALVDVTPPEGAVVNPTSATTDATGQVSFELRLNRIVGTATAFAASAPGGASVSIDVVSEAPPDGTIFGEVNDSESGGNDATPGAGTVTHIQQPSGLAVASDGTVYIADAFNNRVERLSPAGDLTDIVGTARGLNEGYSGDNGPALEARLHGPSGLALDETQTLLFIADSGNEVVRVVDLTTGIITTYAGGGSAPSAPWGDGDPATSAVLSTPGWVGWGPDGASGYALYIADEGHRAMRFVDSSGVIHTLPLPSGTGDCTQDTLDVVGIPAGASMVWDTNANAYLSAQICGTAAGSTYSSDWTGGIVQVTPAGVIGYVAGRAGGSGAENVIATSALFEDVPSLAMDPAGNLFLGINYESRIRRIDGQSAAVTTLAGSTTPGNSGRYVPGPTALLNEPAAIALGGDLNLYVADSSNSAVRTLWGVGSIFASAVTLTDATSYPVSAVWVDAELPPFKVKLAAADGTPLSGYPISWQSLDEGAGLRVTTTLTAADGTTSPSGRVGRAAGSYRFVGTYASLGGTAVSGSPITFTATATVPPSGTIYTVVNVDHVGAPPANVPGPGTFARPAAPTAIALASDGTIYETGTCGIFTLSPQGVLTLFAGAGVSQSGSTCGFGGDGGPALQAFMDPWGIALDEANGKLYFSDVSANRIRVIDLRSTGHPVTTFAGAALSCSSDSDCASDSGAPHCSTTGVCVTCTAAAQCGSTQFCSGGACFDTASNAPLTSAGDSGPALNAVITEPTEIALGNGGLFVLSFVPLYYDPNTGVDVVRFIDANGVISTLPFPVASSLTGNGCTDSNTVAISGLNSLVWNEPAASLYVSASFICTGICDAYGGMASYTPGGSPEVAHFAGGCGSDETGDAASAAASAATTAFGNAPYLAVDPSGTLYMAIDNERRIRRLGTDGNIYTAAGQYDVVGTSGDYGPWGSALFEAPMSIAFGTDGSLVIVDWFGAGTPLRFVQP
jgi:sugar lactone lactonase YvrE